MFNTVERRQTMLDTLTLESICTGINMHGLSDCYKQDNKANKIFWSMLLVCAVILLIISVSLCIWQFMDNPIITTWSIENFSSKKLPNVRICPLNWAHADRFDKAHEKVKDIIQGFWDMHNSKFDPPKSEQTEPSQKTKSKTEGNEVSDGSNDTDDIFKVDNFETSIKTVALKRNEIFQRCYALREEVNCVNISTAVVDGIFGICYDLEDPAKQLPWSTDPTLAVVISLERQKLEPSLRAFNEGLKVFLQDQTTAITISEGQMIPPGVHAIISFVETKKNFLPVNIVGSQGKQHACKSEESRKERRTDTTSTNERSNVDGFSNVLMTAENTYADCMYNCQLTAELNHCGCINIVDSSFLDSAVKSQNLSYCPNDGSLERCYATNTLRQVIRPCVQNCLRPCVSTVYEIATSYSHLSHQFFETRFHRANVSRKPDIRQDLLNKRVSSVADHILQEGKDGRLAGSTRQNFVSAGDDQTEKNYIVLDFRYSSLGTLHIVQSQSMTFNTLTSNVGGQLGLWIGASIFTLAQLVVYCSMICVTRVTNFFKRLCGKNQIDESMKKSEYIYGKNFRLPNNNDAV